MAFRYEKVESYSIQTRGTVFKNRPVRSIYVSLIIKMDDCHHLLHAPAHPQLTLTQASWGYFRFLSLPVYTGFTGVQLKVTGKGREDDNGPAVSAE